MQGLIIDIKPFASVMQEIVSHAYQIFYLTDSKINIIILK